MKPLRLAFACVLLGASAIVPTVALAQTASPSTATPSGTAPSATAPSAPSETETSPPQGRADGRLDSGPGSRSSEVQEGWRSSREEERSRSGGRGGGWDRDLESSDMRGSGRQDRMYGPADDRGPDRRERMMRAHRGMTGPGGMARDDGMPMRMVGRAHMRHHMGPRKQGARLEIKRGESSMRIHCPADEPIAACVEAVSKLVDKLQSVHQTPAP